MPSDSVHIGEMLVQQPLVEGILQSGLPMRLRPCAVGCEAHDARCDAIRRQRWLVCLEPFARRAVVHLPRAPPFCGGPLCRGRVRRGKRVAEDQREVLARARACVLPRLVARPARKVRKADDLLRVLCERAQLEGERVGAPNLWVDLRGHEVEDDGLAAARVVRKAADRVPPSNRLPYVLPPQGGVRLEGKQLLAAEGLEGQVALPPCEVRQLHEHRDDCHHGLAAGEEVGVEYRRGELCEPILIELLVPKPEAQRLAILCDDLRLGLERRLVVEDRDRQAADAAHQAAWKGVEERVCRHGGEQAKDLLRFVGREIHPEKDAVELLLHPHLHVDVGIKLGPPLEEGVRRVGNLCLRPARGVLRPHQLDHQRPEDLVV
mmetsp:Transcript_20528/g.69468  ORF Transcript_20528/g.69468 Transcript_20528/m.69468 type:complete len:377 (+) Transcript_20528:140-1270(+)